jgi:hypothetical protein
LDREDAKALLTACLGDSAVDPKDNDIVYVGDTNGSLGRIDCGLLRS